MLKKFKEYLLHNPYWGVLHESAENQLYIAIDPAKFKSLSDDEMYILDIWNGLSRNMRRELATTVEYLVDSEDEGIDP